MVFHSVAWTPTVRGPLSVRLGIRVNRCNEEMSFTASRPHQGWSDECECTDVNHYAALGDSAGEPQNWSGAFVFVHSAMMFAVLKIHY